MSGIAGWVSAGAEVQRTDLDGIVSALAGRGPDGSAVWLQGRAALIQTEFRTVDDTESNAVPLSADDRWLMVADVRLDAREALVDELLRAGQHISRSSSDAALILAAWQAWREECVHHLAGDFCFAILDRQSHGLFAARDHFGVRPFYYAAAGTRIVFANSMAAMRAAPGVSSELDERAIVDLLVFRYMEGPSDTAFAAIRKLPPGSTLTWRAGDLRISTYWTRPAERPIRFKRDQEYLDGFTEVFRAAVVDRLRTSSVAVAMTGGLDSSSIAVTAAAWRSNGGRASIHPHTIVYDSLIPDRERHFSTLVAQHAGLPITFTVADEYPLHDRAPQPDLQPPEPLHDPFRAMLADYYRGIAEKHRVVLLGLDGDTLLSEVASDYLLANLRRGRVSEYARGVAGYMRTRRELPPHRLRSTVRALTTTVSHRDEEGLPSWLARPQRERWEIDARWSSRAARRRGVLPGWPLRARASVMGSPKWRAMFDRHDAEYLAAPVEARFPFADLRVVNYLLNIPAIPWCIDKHILRRSMQDALPLEVVKRPKTSLAGDPVSARLAKGDRTPWAPGFDAHPLLETFVDAAALRQICERASPGIDPEMDTRALVLNEWLWYHRPRS